MPSFPDIIRFTGMTGYIIGAGDLIFSRGEIGWTAAVIRCIAVPIGAFFRSSVWSGLAEMIKNPRKQNDRERRIGEKEHKRFWWIILVRIIAKGHNSRFHPPKNQSRTAARAALIMLRIYRRLRYSKPIIQRCAWQNCIIRFSTWRNRGCRCICRKGLPCRFRWGY